MWRSISDRKLFDMYFDMKPEDEINPGVDWTFRTVDLFSPDKRSIFPIFCFRCTSIFLKLVCWIQAVVNGTLFLLWNHILDLLYEDTSTGLDILPKLTCDHTKLIPYSIINVKLAAQVFGWRFCKILSQEGLPEASGTARVCMLMDIIIFFNVINIHAHKLQRKP